MNDINELISRVFRAAMLFMSGCLLVWALVPEWKTYAAGFVLGTVISLINARILGYKILKMTEVALANTGKRVNSGYIGRTSMVLIGTMISVKYTQFHLVTTIIGFFFAQLAVFPMGLFFTDRLHKGKR